MPVVNREDLFSALMAESFRDHVWAAKLSQICTIVVTVTCFIVPQKLKVALGLQEDRQNVGRLKTVIPRQIYQQASFGGLTQCTIFFNRRRDGILMYVPPRVTPAFIKDIQALLGGAASVRYIVAHNEAHESFAEDAKKRWPSAQVICPKPSRALVEEAVHVDKTVEDEWYVLEKEFGFVKMFRFDETSRCHSERSYVVELFDDAKDSNDDKSQRHCLFVAQCGVGNYSQFDPHKYLSGFQGLLSPRGRWFRMYYNCFVADQKAVHPFWTRMVSSVDSLELAVFTHGDPIGGAKTKDTLLQFYTY